jgi:hypothetical protein
LAAHDLLATREAAMRSHVDKLVLLALLALFVHAHTQLGTVRAKPAHDAPNHAHSAPPDRPMTKFDLLFGGPEFARP